MSSCYLTCTVHTSPDALESKAADSWYVWMDQHRPHIWDMAVSDNKTVDIQTLHQKKKSLTERPASRGLSNIKPQC